MILTMFDDDDDDDEICGDEDEEEANDEDISRVVICTLYEGFDLIQRRAGCIIVPHHRLNHQEPTWPWRKWQCVFLDVLLWIFVGFAC